MSKTKMPVFKPVGDRIVVQRKPKSDVTPGGIALPTAAQETKSVGTVIAVGPGALRGWRQPGEDERYPMQVKVGDKVLLPIGTQVIKLDEMDDDSEICIAQENQILAILE